MQKRAKLSFDFCQTCTLVSESNGRYFHAMRSVLTNKKKEVLLTDTGIFFKS